MNHFYAFIRRGATGLVLILLTIPFITSSVNAEIVCMATTPISGLDASNYHLELADNNLVFVSDATTLSRYDLNSGITSPITSNFFNSNGKFDLDGDHVVFVDQAEQIQLYTISTGTTTAITDGDKQHSDPRIEGNNVVYRKRKQTADGKVFYKLYVYDIAGATTTKVGPKYPKGYDYDLNQGRILWYGNRLYTIATHSNISLGSYNFIDVDGHYAVTVFRDLGYIRKTLLLKDLSTGIVSTIAQYTNTAQDELIDIENVVVSGDYLAWVVDYFDTESSHQWINLYQISSGKYIETGISNGGLAFVGINEPFVTGKIYDSSQDYWSLYLYDIPSTSLTELVYEDYIASITHVTDQRNIAWIGAKYDPVTEDTYDVQLFLRTNCGSTPKIIAQSHDLNILTGRSAELYVLTTANLPITYQWYQGEKGDTSTPVGTGGSTFTTPPLTQPVSYWVQLVNAYGVETSELIVVTPGDTAELIIDGSFEQGLYGDAPAWKSKQLGKTVNLTYNQPDEPPVVHTGVYALAMHGSEFSKAKVNQQLVNVPYQSGDLLTLQVWIMGKVITPASASIQLKVDYADGTKAKAILKPTLPDFNYTLFSTEPISISGIVQAAKVQIKYAGKQGTLILDDFSVIQSSGNQDSPGIMPLPPSGLTGSQ